MDEKIVHDTAENRRLFIRVFDRVPEIIDLLPLCDSIAKQIGCEPPLAELRRDDPATYKRLMKTSINGLQYKLQGPGAQPEAMKNALHVGPTTGWHDNTTYLWMDTILHMLTGDDLEQRRKNLFRRRPRG